MSARNRYLELDIRQRRQFIKALSGFLGMPFIPKDLIAQFGDYLGGSPLAQELSRSVGTLFLEINLRDQWDFGHVMVSPGLATNADLKRGEKGYKAALFYKPGELEQAAAEVFLTHDSMALKPHLDTIAMLETCELPMGVIHGHEAASALRSPGRSYQPGPGRSEMWLQDPHTKRDGNERHFSSTPTPATLHNYWMKQINAQRRPGIAFKGISRSIHTVFHFAAGLKDAELDRYQSVKDLIRGFREGGADATYTPVYKRYGELFFGLLKEVDSSFLKNWDYGSAAENNHLGKITSVQEQMMSEFSYPPVDLTLSEAERDYWSSGVPEQQGEILKANIWEQCAYAAKLMTSGVLSTVALEFDYADIHDQRTEMQMRIEGKQTSLPLARLIETFKKAGLYDRTVIAIYTTDGSRSPAANSFGSEGKSAFMLAGGAIKGGYFGDVRVTGNKEDGHTFGYHTPDLVTGVCNPTAITDNSQRISGASVYRTIAKAAGIDAALVGSFSDVGQAPLLEFLI